MRWMDLKKQYAHESSQWQKGHTLCDFIYMKCPEHGNEAQLFNASGGPLGSNENVLEHDRGDGCATEIVLHVTELYPLNG